MRPEWYEGVKEFGSYSKYDEKPLESFKQESDIIWFMFWISLWLCGKQAERGQEWTQRWIRNHGNSTDKRLLD